MNNDTTANYDACDRKPTAIFVCFGFDQAYYGKYQTERDRITQYRQNKARYRKAVCPLFANGFVLIDRYRFPMRRVHKIG